MSTKNQKFNRVYSPILLDLETEPEKAKRYNVLKGGAGAGKSRAIAQCLLKRIIRLEKYKVLAMRKVFNTIRESLFTEFQTVIDEADMASEFKVIESPFRYRHLPTGNEIIFGGMDDPAKLKSVSGINCIWLEEADQFELADFLEANSRLRGKCQYPHQMFISFNPTSELSWLKATFFDPGNPYEDEALILETTFRDNCFMDAAYAKVLHATGASDPNYMRIMLNGEWGRLSTNGLFYKHFDTNKHQVFKSAKELYDPEAPLWISWDFNVVPSCTCLVFQLLGDGKTLVQIDEFQAKSPNNNTAGIAKAFLAKYRHQHRSRLYVTGDPAGRHRDTRGEDGRNDYTIIQNELAAMSPIIRVPSVAPNQVSRGDFINAIFFSDYSGLSIRVAAHCKATIRDLSNQKETNTGKDKRKVKDKETGESYEQYGHCSDAFDYCVYTIWPGEYETHKQGPKGFDFLFGRNKLSSKYF